MTLSNEPKSSPKGVIRLCRALPAGTEATLIRNQLFRSATSVGANYRSACRCRSHADFVNKLGIVLEEADESLYWMELLSEMEIVNVEQLKPLVAEANELVAIFVAGLKKAKTEHEEPGQTETKN